MNSKKCKYSLVVRYVDARTSFIHDSTKPCAHQSPYQLIDAFRALIDIVREPPNPGNVNQTDVPKQRQFLNDYLDETPNSARQVEIRKRILDGSRRSLEQQ